MGTIAHFDLERAVAAAPRSRAGKQGADAPRAPRIPGAPELPPERPDRPLDERTVVSVVVPCFNEEDVLPALFERVRSAAEAWGTRHEVVLVDDGSTDATWELVRQCHAADPRWRGVRLARNFGHQAAVWAGLKAARGDVVAVLDADLQDPPEVLPRLLDRWAEGYDVVYAVRTRRKEGPLKRLAYFAYYRLLAAVADVGVPLDAGDFGLIDRRVVDVMARSREPEPFVRGLRAYVGFRQLGVPYERDARAAGRVKYTLPKLARLALHGVVSTSTKPLRLAAWLGLAATAAALLAAVAALAVAPSGPLAVVAAVLFLGGVQLVCLGILGEYVGRVYEAVRGRPAPAVRGTVGEFLSPEDGA